LKREERREKREERREKREGVLPFGTSIINLSTWFDNHF
jgi:hypothetical protein